MHIVMGDSAAASARKASAARRGALSRLQLQDVAMAPVRAAWQALLGPAPLAAPLIEQLLLLSNLRNVSAGQQVLSRHDVASGLILLVQGDVGLGVSAPPAPLRIERSLHGPAWLDLTSAWLDCSPALDGVALDAAILVNVSRSAYQTLMERHPELARRTIVSLAAQARAATGMTHDLMHKDAQARLASWLVQRCDAGAATPQITLNERKRDIASQLAVTPETLSRLLKQFSGEGLLRVHGYAIAVLDLAGLQTRAQADAPDQAART